MLRFGIVGSYSYSSSGSDVFPQIWLKFWSLLSVRIIWWYGTSSWSWAQYEVVHSRKSTCEQSQVVKDSISHSSTKFSGTGNGDMCWWFQTSRLVRQTWMSYPSSIAPSVSQYRDDPVEEILTLCGRVQWGVLCDIETTVSKLAFIKIGVLQANSQESNKSCVTKLISILLQCKTDQVNYVL